MAKDTTLEALRKLAVGLQKLAATVEATLGADDDEGEEEEPKPKKKPAAAAPPKKKPPVDDDDDDTEEEEEEAPPPKKKPKKPVEDDDEDDEPVAKKPAKKKPVEDEEEESEEDTEEEGDELSTMPRVKLVGIARDLGVETSGIQNEQLRDAIRKARAKKGKGAGGKAGPAKKKPAADDDDDDGPREPSKPKVKLSVLQDTLVGILEERWEDLKESVEELGCGGDCHNCPTPETDGDVEKQVKDCLTAVSEDLKIKLDKSVKAALG